MYLDAFLINLYDKLYHSLHGFITLSKRRYINSTDHSIAISNGGRTFVSFCGFPAAGNVLSAESISQGCEDFMAAQRLLPIRHVVEKPGIVPKKSTRGERLLAFLYGPLPVCELRESCTLSRFLVFGFWREP